MDLESFEQAMAEGSLERVRWWLASRSNIKEQDARGITPLMAAARAGHGDIVEYLCQSGADVNQVSRNGETALYVACSNANLEASEILLRYGSAVNIQTNDLHPQTGRTPLMAAIPISYDHITGKRKKSDSLAIIRCLVAHKCDLNKQEWTGSTALHLAAERSDVHTVCLLADSGADLQVRNKQGLTAFEYAIQPGIQRYDIAYILLLYGYDTEEAVSPEHSLVSVIQGITHQEARYFVSSKIHRRRLCQALVELMQWNLSLLNSVGLLLSGISKDDEEQFIAGLLVPDIPETLQSICRRTIRRAIKRSVFQGIRELKVASAIKNFLALNYDVENHDPLSVLDLNLQVKENNIRFVKQIIQTGIDVNFTLTDHTPLTEAVICGNTELFQVLVNSGASINQPDSTGLTGLHWAASKGHLTIVKELLDREADINKTKENLNENAVTLGAKYGHFEVMDYLTQNGGNPNVPANTGIYAIHFAAGSGHVGAVRNLLEHKVSSSTRDCFGNTPLHVAASRGLLYTSRNIDLPALFENEIAMNMNGIRNNMGYEPSMKYFRTVSDKGPNIDHLGVVKLLLESGAERSPVNSQNLTPADVALQFQQNDIVSFLSSWSINT